MSDYLKKMAKGILASPPIVNTLRRLNVRRDTVGVLCYHTLGRDDGNIDAWTVLRQSDFKRQISEIRKHFEIVSLDEAFLEKPSVSGRPRAVLTFDDGDAGLFNYLLPIVEAEKLPATVYVATSQIVDGTPYWFDQIMNALQIDGAIDIDLTEFGLGQWQLPIETGGKRWLVVSEILEALKTVSPDFRYAAAGKISELTYDRLRPDFEQLHPMTVEQLKKLASSQWVTIGSHSHCHSLLDQIPAAQVFDSAMKSRKLLQEWTGQPVEHFAYPNGNNSPEVRGTIENLGFASATVLDNKLWQPNADRFSISRIAVGRYDSIDRIRLRLAGV